MYVGSSDEAYATIRGKYNRSNEYNRSEVRFGVEDNSVGEGFLAFATGTNSATERMRIDSSGRNRILVILRVVPVWIPQTLDLSTVQVNTTNTGSGGNNARRSFVANTPIGSANVDACALGLFDGGNFASAISLRYNSSSSYDFGFHVADTGSQGNNSPTKIMYIKGETTDKGRLVLTNACNGINFGDTISSAHTLDDYEEGTFDISGNITLTTSGSVTLQSSYDILELH